MQPRNPNPERELIRERIEEWRAVDSRMAELRITDSESITTQEAIRQIFEGMDFIFDQPAPTTSGLVEQQKWFAKIRAASKAPE